MILRKLQEELKKIENIKETVIRMSEISKFEKELPMKLKKYKNELVDLTTTDNTTIYTTPASSRAIIKSIIVSEDAGSGSTITFTITNAASAVFNLFKDKAIASKATTELLTHPLILEENEVLKAQAADANELHVIASILEINRD